VADKPSQLVLEALARAAASGAPLLLHGTRTTPGLFPITALGKQAAQRCCDEGLLRPAASPGAISEAPESVGGPEEAANGLVPAGTLTLARPREGVARYIITDKGLAHLLRQTNPRQVLEDFVRALEAREGQAGQLLSLAGQMQASLVNIRTSVEQVLKQLVASPAVAAGAIARSPNAQCRDFHVPAPSTSGPVGGEPAKAPDVTGDLAAALQAQVQRWGSAGSTDDCPLPWLFRQLAQASPGLTIGQFHDALRLAHEMGRIYLHPWTGPLYELPEPPYALLVGHLVAYYASCRSGQPS
jgi:hypothetical protein